MGRRYIILFLLVLVGALGASRALAQGDLLCTGGTRDGQDCVGPEDCTPDGVCVIAQGVCDGGTDDGLPCDCAGGTCTSTPVCSDDATLGTCNGGPFATDCCDVTSNCAESRSCRGTQKVCLGGINKGFSCLNAAQCPNSQCASSKKVCDGGDFDGFACVDNSDCTGTAPTTNGECIGVAANSPTPTRTRTPTRVSTAPTATRTATRTGSVVPTTSTPATRTPTGATPATLTPTGGTPATATQTPPTVIANTGTPTRTLGPGMARLAAAIVATDTDITLDNARSFPPSGKIKIDSELITYSGKPRNGNVLSGAVRGAICSDAAPHALGAEVLDVSSRTIECRIEGRGSGCAIETRRATEMPTVLLVGVGFVAWIARRRVR